MALAATTLGLCILGVAGAILLAARRGVAAVGLGVVFACGALRQGLLIHSGSIPAWQLDPSALAELSMLGIAVGGLFALRALQRTTRERDRVEDLHWDSMEAVRVMSELSARPVDALEGRLARVLELGAARFGLDLGLAWQDDGSEDGRVLGVRAPHLDAQQRDACVAALLPRLRDAAGGTRPLAMPGVDPGAAPAGTGRARLAVVVAAPLVCAGATRGVLAFAGTGSAKKRFNATEKDLIGLMAWWLSSELERSARAEEVAALERRVGEAELAGQAERAPAAEAAPPAGPGLLRVARDAWRARRGVDLNRGITRLESRLRQRVGTDGTLSLDLAADLPPLARGRLSAPRLVEGLVDAAARLAPLGRIELSTHAPPDASGEVTLKVGVEASDVDAQALKRVFERSSDDFDPEETSRATLPLADIERLLRADGGDLSVSVEPQRRAVFTAWLPVASRDATQPRGPNAHRSRAAPPSDA